MISVWCAVVIICTVPLWKNFVTYFSTTVPISMQVFSAASRNAGSGCATFTKSACYRKKNHSLRTILQRRRIHNAQYTSRRKKHRFRRVKRYGLKCTEIVMCRHRQLLIITLGARPYLTSLLLTCQSGTVCWPWLGSLESRESCR